MLLRCALIPAAARLLVHLLLHFHTIPLLFTEALRENALSRATFFVAGSIVGDILVCRCCAAGRVVAQCAGYARRVVASSTAECSSLIPAFIPRFFMLILMAMFDFCLTFLIASFR